MHFDMGDVDDFDAESGNNTNVDLLIVYQVSLTGVGEVGCELPEGHLHSRGLRVSDGAIEVEEDRDVLVGSCLLHFDCQAVVRGVCSCFIVETSAAEQEKKEDKIAHNSPEQREHK